MQNLIAMSYITSTKQAHFLGKIATVSIMFSHLFGNIAILIYTFVDFDCFSMPSFMYPRTFCPSYEQRREYLFHEWEWQNGKTLIFASIFFTLSLFIMLTVPHFLIHFLGRTYKEALTQWDLQNEKDSSWFKPTVSNSRNFPSLVRTGNFEGLVEILEFGFKIPKNVTAAQILNKCLNVIINTHKDVQIDKMIVYFKYVYDTYQEPVDFIV